MGALELLQKKHLRQLKHQIYPILVDVRTEAEWNDGYIETAIHIPLDKILQKIEFATENKEQTIYLYCRSGAKKAKISQSRESIAKYRLYQCKEHWWN